MHGIRGFSSFAGNYGAPTMKLVTPADAPLLEFERVQAGGTPGTARTPLKFMGSRTKAGVVERASAAYVDRRTGTVTSLKRTLDVTKVVTGGSTGTGTSTAGGTGASGFALSANPFNPFQGGDVAALETGASSVGQPSDVMADRPWWHYALGLALVGGVGYAGYKLYTKKAA